MIYPHDSFLNKAEEEEEEREVHLIYCLLALGY